MDEHYLNADQPASVPLAAAHRPIPVIARFVLVTGEEEYRPAMAIRWTSTHVLVGVGTTYQQEYTWLRVHDVTRVLRRPGC